jgi:hypothetical protein
VYFAAKCNKELWKYLTKIVDNATESAIIYSVSICNGGTMPKWYISTDKHYFRLFSAVSDKPVLPHNGGAGML